MVTPAADLDKRDPLPRWLPLVLLAGVLIASFYRLLFGEVLYWGLPALQFYPWRDLSTQELLAGRLPLWNPYNGAGAPLLANYQSAILYPPHLLYLIFPGPYTMGVLAIIHIAWAGLGMFWLCKRLNIPTFGQSIAVLAYPFSGTLIARMGTIPMLEAAAWLPWLIFLVDRLIARADLLNVLFFALASAMLLLVGHAQWAFYSLLLTGAYALWQILAKRGPALRLGITVAAIVLGAGIAAIQLLPTAELQRQSQRASGVGEAFALNFSFPPISTLTFLNPHFFGNPADGSYVIGGAYFETAAYIGVLPFTLAIVGLGSYILRRKRSGTHLIAFFGLAAVITVIFATGSDGPIYRFLYRSVPTFNMFQAPARWLLITVFSLTMIAALVSRDWKPGRMTRYVSRIILVTAVLLVVLGTLISGNYADNALMSQLFRGVQGVGILLFLTALIYLSQPRAGQDLRRRRMWMIGVLLFLAVDIGWSNYGLNPTTSADFYTPQRPDVAGPRTFATQADIDKQMFDVFLPFQDYRVAGQRRDAYRSADLPDLNILDRRGVWNNFDPLRPDWIERYTRLLTDNLPESATGKALRDAAYIQGGARAWIVNRAVAVNSPDDAERAITSAGWSPRESVIIEAESAAGASSVGEAKIVKESPLDVEIAVTSSADAYLVLADAWYPGWRASVDETSTPIYRANVAFRAVHIPAGNHTVRFTYQPNSFVIGAGISAGSIIGAVVLLIAGLRRRTDSGQLPNATK